MSGEIFQYENIEMNPTFPLRNISLQIRLKIKRNQSAHAHVSSDFVARIRRLSCLLEIHFYSK